MDLLLNINKKASKKVLQDINKVEDLDLIYERFMLERKSLAKGESLFLRFMVAWDTFFFTQKPEYLDLPEIDAQKKDKEVRLLHRINLLSKAYELFYNSMTPYLDQKKDKKLRILELGSGSGEFLIFFTKKLCENGFQCEVIGSDYNTESVLRSNKKIEKTNLPLKFIELNMFDLEHYETEPFDFIFINQAIHHFSLKELALIYTQCVKICVSGIFALDGRRNLKTLILLTVVGAFGGVLQLSWPFFHDSFVSAIKFFPPPLLSGALKVALPDADIKISPAGIAHIFVKVLI